MSDLDLTFMRFRLSYTSMYPGKQTNNICLTYSKSQDGGKPLQLASICSSIHLEYNAQVGCYLFHTDLKLTIYSSGLPTAFRNHLPLQFNTTESWRHKHVSQVTSTPNRANQRVLHAIHHSLAHNKNTDTS